MDIKIDKKVSSRISEKTRFFRKVLQDAKERDVNESDTVTIVVDMLVEIFGFDRYKEVTKEYAIRGTFCDLAVKIDNRVKILIEVKAIGLSLKEQFIRQATNYGAHEGIEWVVLTNGIEWFVYHIGIKNSIKIQELLRFNLLDNTSLNNVDIFSLCREGIKKSAIDKIYEYQAIVNKYCIASLLISDDIKKIIIRRIKNMSSGTKVSNDDIDNILRNEIIKRDIIDSDDFKNYCKKNQRVINKKNRIKKSDSSTQELIQENANNSPLS